jgi:cytochrome c551/c552
MKLFTLICAVLPAAAVPQPVRLFLDKNCTGCHQGAKAPAGIDLKTLAMKPDDAELFRRWVRVHDAVKNGSMPPGGRIPSQQRTAFTAAVAAPLAAHERARVAAHGRSTLRRLNRYEYEESVRDLLGAPWLHVRDSLPEDGIVQRFNKSGQALDVSHVQMARYMEAAEDALRQVVAASRQGESVSKHYARDQKRLLHRMRYSPFNRHPERATIPILGFSAQPDVLAEKVPITVGPADPATRELEAFVSPAGNYVGNEHHFDTFTAPVGGRYRLRLNFFSIWIHTVWHQRGDKLAWWRPNREKTSRGRTVEPVTIYAYRRGEKRLLGTFDVTPEPSVHEMDVMLLPGDQILPDPARLFRSRPGFTGSPEATAEGMPGVAYRWMEVAGPVSSADAAQRLFGGGDPERLLRRFINAAYRRPASEDEVRRYLSIVRERLAQKVDFTEAMIAGYTAVLCSPGFLYLHEAPGPLTSRALANRLSYFLWNAPPDAELRAVSNKGMLRSAAVLRAQTDRLLDNPRSTRFIDAFLDYWLDLRKVGETIPDQTLYPDYYLDDLLTESAVQETRLFFSEVLRGNRPARELIQCDWTYANSHLAKHYGLPPVEGAGMRRIALPPDSVRGGLLTQASVLKVTANGTTTSPVLRGVWIMERILGDPPSPPPPGVPAVEPDTRGATTIRQQLDKHRATPSCAGCHRKIDPPGFALESFDVLGGWRDRYRSTEQGEPVKGLGRNGIAYTFRNGQAVDASGEMAGGDKFVDIREFKALLVKNERQVARNMVHQFVAYGTGAPIGFSDRADVERILDAAARDGYRLRTILHQVIQSRLFRNK